jgi:hypothetical protein
LSVPVMLLLPPTPAMVSQCTAPPHPVQPSPPRDTEDCDHPHDAKRRRSLRAPKKKKLAPSFVTGDEGADEDDEAGACAGDDGGSGSASGSGATFGRQQRLAALPGLPRLQPAAGCGDCGAVVKLEEEEEAAGLLGAQEDHDSGADCGSGRDGLLRAQVGAAAAAGAPPAGAGGQSGGPSSDASSCGGAAGGEAAFGLLPGASASPVSAVPQPSLSGGGSVCTTPLATLPLLRGYPVGADDAFGGGLASLLGLPAGQLSGSCAIDAFGHVSAVQGSLVLLPAALGGAGAEQQLPQMDASPARPVSWSRSSDGSGNCGSNSANAGTTPPADLSSDPCVGSAAADQPRAGGAAAGVAAASTPFAAAAGVAAAAAVVDSAVGAGGEASDADAGVDESCRYIQEVRPQLLPCTVPRRP